jgi:hypothetical protein
VSLLLLSSIALVVAALTGSVMVLVRSGESRVLVLTGLLASLGAQQGVALWQTWGDPARFDLATGAAAAGLATSALGLLAVLALGRTLRDLDRAETLHWESMEGVRGLTDLAARRDVDLEERLPVLLEMGGAAGATRCWRSTRRRTSR